MRPYIARLCVYSEDRLKACQERVEWRTMTFVKKIIVPAKELWKKVMSDNSWLIQYRFQQNH